MIKPNIQLSKISNVSYYSLVVAIAKRAREIAAEAELKGEILVEKPVDLAVNEYIAGAFKIVEPKECAVIPGAEYDGPAQVQDAVLADEEPFSAGDFTL